MDVLMCVHIHSRAEAPMSCDETYNDFDDGWSNDIREKAAAIGEKIGRCDGGV